MGSDLTYADLTKRSIDLYDYRLMQETEVSDLMFKVPELKRRLTFTALILLIYRLGSHVPTPGIDGSALSLYFETLAQQGGQTLFGLYDLFVGGNRGAFTHLMFVVSGGDLEVRDLDITFGNGQRFDAKTKHYFRNGSRSRAIDLPGYARNIKSIQFKYGAINWGGRAQVTVYGRDRRVVFAHACAATNGSGPNGDGRPIIVGGPAALGRL